MNLTGTLGSNSTSMSGNYTILGTGCTSTNLVPGSGTWSANLVSSLNGNIQGTLVSKTQGDFAMTGNVTQGPNTGISNATLSGTVNVPGYCIGTATISGAISGTSVIINLLSSNGTQIGQIAATTSLDGTLLNGTYNFIGEGSTGTAGCKAFDSGTVSFTL